MLVTGGPLVRGGGGMPQRIRSLGRDNPGIRLASREVSDIAVDNAEQRRDGGLIGRDGIEIAHGS